jgi:cytochrome c-type biogenesis protein CcmE
VKLKFVIGGGIILAALAYMVFGVLGQNLVFFITPSQYFQDPTRYQGEKSRERKLKNEDEKKKK